MTFSLTFAGFNLELPEFVERAETAEAAGVSELSGRLVIGSSTGASPPPRERVQLVSVNNKQAISNRHTIFFIFITSFINNIGCVFLPSDNEHLTEGQKVASL